ncbi:hypothetical protein [Lacticaseibacillus rhamnosus]|uniref:hypothetical protein n=1 Tax=Lacticaseibacillus rhamnosus TaxID=47715 RepID=UPI000A7E7460|nr:hypothetical protein [Lacticaseibacillus rhamnosus]UZW78940.1 hypothetical protein MUB25_04380 [Lacticaseibacillus rhamnosus]
MLKDYHHQEAIARKFTKREREPALLEPIRALKHFPLQGISQYPKNECEEH